MQCPGCGYEADDAAVFCPQCRYQFRDTDEEEPLFAADTIIDLPERGIITDERVLEEPRQAPRETGRPGQPLPEKERFRMEVWLLQPSLLVVLIVALASYTVLSAVPFIPLVYGGISVGIAGPLCLATGLFAGLVFFFLVRHSIRSFRFL